MNTTSKLQHAWRATAQSLGNGARSLGHGLLEVSHNSLAMVGLVAVAILVFALARADIRLQVEDLTLDWLQTRQEQRDGLSHLPPAEPDAVSRTTAADPKDLPRQQAAVASWIARRYKVAPEPISALVQEAWGLGRRAGLDPTLILAIMAVESSFNPFAQSTVGAQGLMQVVTRVHDDKYEAFGGNHAAFDPISNLRVGVLVLKECIARAGNLQDGLRYYVGAALHETDGGYAARVLSEQAHLRAVADGKRVPFGAALVRPAPAPVKANSATPQTAPAAIEAATEMGTERPIERLNDRSAEKLALLR